MQHALEGAFARGTYGTSRRTFVRLAAAAGITAVGGALVFPEAHAQARFTEPTRASWPHLTDAGKVRFTVHSDTHVGSLASNNWQDKMPAAFRAIYEVCPDVDAHFFAGDSTDTGAPRQYDELAGLLNDNAKAPVGIVMGNHEYYSVTIYRLDFREGAVLDEPWTIDVASGADGFRYGGA